jgi:hypothetical protein
MSTEILKAQIVARIPPPLQRSQLDENEQVVRLSSQLGMIFTKKQWIELSELDSIF